MGYDISQQDVAAIATKLGLSLDQSELDLYHQLVDDTLGLYRGLANLPPPGFPEIAPRAYRTPDSTENPLNGWHVRTEIRDVTAGGRILAGRSVAIKDNILVAGLPMLNGSATLRGLIGDIDATVVSRVLAAGGTITGKAHCEAYCLSCSSFTNITGHVLNPHDPARSAGGSSSGSAALVASEAVDMALGTDQGGSVRMPSSYCGVYGMKPTFGLVPYTGAMPMEASVDHIGPITRNVEDNARLLEAIAGAGGLDPRQQAPGEISYSSQLSSDVAGLRIGVLREGFGHAISNPDVDTQVRTAARRYASLGAVVTEISIPEHLIAPLIWFPLVTTGATFGLLSGGGYGLSGNELFSPALVEAQSQWAASSQQLPVTVRVFLMAGLIAQERTGAKPFASAANLRRTLRDAFDKAFEEVDLILMPTMPYTAPLLPNGTTDIVEQFGFATQAAVNTISFNITGHPAISLPCGKADGMPVGLMLSGACHSEPTLYRAALAYQDRFDWTVL